MLQKWSPYLLSVLRIVAALLFFEHGTQKLFGYPPGQPYTGFPNFSLLGIAGMMETVGGATLLTVTLTADDVLVLPPVSRAMAVNV